MKRILGLIFYVLAVVIGVFVTLLLFLQALTTIGMLSSNGKEPGLFVSSFFFLFGTMLSIFLFRLGHNISQSKQELGVGTKLNLLFIGIVVDVVVLLKSAVAFLTQNHGVWSGSFAILSALTFAALCWLFAKL
jgi:hypothetical protein